MGGTIKDRIVDRLHFMPSGNRTVKPSLVTKLKKSIKEYGILRSVVIVKTDVFGEGMKYYIADGQHLFMSVQALNMIKDLNVIEVKRRFNSVQEIVEFVSVLNTSQSPWRLSDYIGAYASTQHYLSYNVLIAKKKHYKLSFNLLAMIYGGLSKKEAANLIREGQFRIKDEIKGNKVSDIIVGLIPVFGRVNSTALYNLAAAFHDWYNPSQFDAMEFKSHVAQHVNKLSNFNEEQMIKFLADYSKMCYV